MKTLLEGMADVVCSGTGNVYSVVAEDFIRAGDKVAWTADGKARKARDGDVAVGTAVRARYPAGRLFVWREVEG